MKNSSHTGRRLAALALAPLLLLVPLARTARAHNAMTHQQMTVFAYEALRAVEIVLADDFPHNVSNDERAKLTAEIKTPPPGVPAAEWDAFLRHLAEGARRLRDLRVDLPPPKSPACGADIAFEQFCADPVPADRKRPGDGWSAGRAGQVRFPVVQTYKTGTDCGVWTDWSPPARFARLNSCVAPGGGLRPHRDHTGTLLGFYAQSPDDEIPDSNLWVRPTTIIGGPGFIKEAADKLVEGGAALALLPIFALLMCLADLLGFDGVECGDSLDAATEAGKAVPVPSDLEGMIPGVGDIEGGDYTTLWHFINMTPGVSNEFDDRQGLFYEEAGLDRDPGALDIAILAATDLSAISFDYDESRGIHRYQIRQGGDGHRDTRIRGRADWQKYPLGRTPVSPLDNLGFFGWRSYRTNPAETRWLGWPLHALGDASSPMHVIGSTSYGHRPFEDAQERLWPRISEDLGADLRPLLARAFFWRRFVLDWRARAAGRRRDVPVRDMVTALAQQTLDYSRQQQTATGNWPFQDHLSALYFFAGAKNETTTVYADRPGAVALVRPLMLNGVGAKMTFLASAMEASQ